MNPRAAINDLLPFQGSPFGQLGYFSKSPYAITSFFRSVSHYIALCFVCQELFIFLNQRREWDSNPRALADKRFSRPPRYDHFDISPKRSLKRAFTFYTILAFLSSAFQNFFYIFFRSSKKAAATVISSGVVTLIFR